ncbi:MAG: hypothetical protein WBG08_00175 [Litorimonas sp.]
MPALEAEAPRPVEDVSDMLGAWQLIHDDGGYEVLEVRTDSESDDTIIDYETADFRQAGWTVTDVADGRVTLAYVRGPGVSAIDFPAGDYPLYDRLRRNAATVSLDGDTLQLDGSPPLSLQAHPGQDLALPPGQVWSLSASYDDLAERYPDEFSKAYISFGGYSVGAYGGCNGGGATFVQYDGQFVPSGMMMTQMFCSNYGDELAAWMVREGPAFERSGDTLWRDFPEGRVSYRVADAPDRSGG